MIYRDDIAIEMLLHLEMSSKPKMTIFQHEDRLISHWRTQHTKFKATHVALLWNRQWIKLLLAITERMSCDTQHGERTQHITKFSWQLPTSVEKMLYQSTVVKCTIQHSYLSLANKWREGNLHIGWGFQITVPLFSAFFTWQCSCNAILS